MEESTLYLITQVFIAIGTTVVCILAVWGDKIRSYIAGPRLRLEAREKIEYIQKDILH